MKNLTIAVFLATALMLFVSADAMAQATVTVTGTIYSGTDVTGVFGFGPNYNLAGKSFTLVYTFSTTLGTQTESCGNSTYENYLCESGVSGSPGGVIITANSGTPYDDNSTGTNTRELFGYIPVGYQVGLGSADTAVSISGKPSGTPNFDWRTSFSASTVSAASGTFNINDGTNQANAVLTPHSLSETGVNCSASSVALEINNDNDPDWLSYPQPNILGGSLAANQITTVNILVAPTTSALPVVSFADTDDKAADEAFSIGAIPNPDGLATMQYISTLSANTVNDSLTGTMCTTESSPVKVYDFYPYLDTAHTTQFDIGQSQVSNAVFATTSITASEIQTFLENVVTDGSFLANFYFDNTTADGGWYNPDGTGQLTSTYAATDDAYCPTSTTCPVLGDSGTLASTLVASIAEGDSINPEVVAATLQKEYSIISKTSLPTVAQLNGAMGAGCSSSATFYKQLVCGSQTFHTWFTDSAITYPYFFPVNAAEKAAYPDVAVNYSLQYSYGTVQCKKGATTHANCDLVGLWMNNAATFAQYKYTPFVQTESNGSFGGYHGFEYFWFQYSSNGWYQ
jgi:hypothetical protein